MSEIARGAVINGRVLIVSGNTLYVQVSEGAFLKTVLDQRMSGHTLRGLDSVPDWVPLEANGGGSPVND